MRRSAASIRAHSGGGGEGHVLGGQDRGCAVPTSSRSRSRCRRCRAGAAGDWVIGVGAERRRGRVAPAKPGRGAVWWGGWAGVRLAAGGRRVRRDSRRRGGRASRWRDGSGRVGIGGQTGQAASSRRGSAGRGRGCRCHVRDAFGAPIGHLDTLAAALRVCIDDLLIFDPERAPKLSDAGFKSPQLHQQVPGVFTPEPALVPGLSGAGSRGILDDVGRDYGAALHHQTRLTAVHLFRNRRPANVSTCTGLMPFGIRHTGSAAGPLLDLFVSGAKRRPTWTCGRSGGSTCSTIADR